MTTTARERVRAKARLFEERSEAIVARLQTRVHEMSELERRWAKLYFAPLGLAGDDGLAGHHLAVSLLMGLKRGLELAQERDLEALDAIHREVYARPLTRGYAVYRLPRQTHTIEDVIKGVMQ